MPRRRKTTEMGDNPSRYKSKSKHHYEDSIGYTEDDIEDLRKLKEEKAKKNKSKRNLSRKYRFKK